MQPVKLERTEAALRIVHEAVMRKIVTPLPHTPGTPLDEQLRIYARSVRKDAARQLWRLRFSFSALRPLKMVLKVIKKEARFIEKNNKEITEEYQYHFFCSESWTPKQYLSGDIYKPTVRRLTRDLYYKVRMTNEGNKQQG